MLAVSRFLSLLKVTVHPFLRAEFKITDICSETAANLKVNDVVLFQTLTITCSTIVSFLTPSGNASE